MTAIVGFGNKDVAIIVTDTLVGIGTYKENNGQKVFSGKDYAIGFAGLIPVELMTYFSENISTFVGQNATSKEVLSAIASYITEKYPKHVGKIECICIKSGTMSYKPFNLLHPTYEAQNEFIGIGSGGTELSVALASLFHNKDISLSSYEEIRTECEKAMKYTSEKKAGVGTNVRIYMQKPNTQMFIYDGESNKEYETVEFSAKETKKISSIVASSALCSDGYTLSPEFLVKLAQNISSKPAIMRYMPLGNKEHHEHGEDQIVGYWSNGSTINVQGITLAKADGYIDKDSYVGKNLSTSISLTPTEIAIKNINGKKVRAVLDAILDDISITDSPCDDFCQILEAKGSAEGDIEDYCINSFSFKINDINFTNCNMSENTNETQNVSDVSLQASTTEEVQAVNITPEVDNAPQVDNVPTTDDTPQPTEPTPPQETPPAVDSEKEELKQKVQTLINENTEFKQKIQTLTNENTKYVELIDKVVPIVEKYKNKTETYEKVLNNKNLLKKFL